MRHKRRTLMEVAIALDVLNDQVIEGLLKHGSFEPVKDGDLTLGQIEAVINILGREKFDLIRSAAQVRVTFENQAATVQIIAKGPSQCLIHGMFVSCEEQVRNIAKWNRKFGWGFTEAQIAEALATAPVWPNHSLMTVAVLVPYLATTGQTFEALWTIVSSRQKNKSRYEGLRSAVNQLRYLDDDAHVPGLL